MKYFTRTKDLGFMAAVIAVLAGLCTLVHVENQADTMLFGTWIPLAVFGFVGYFLIAGTAWIIGRGGLTCGKYILLGTINHLAVAFAALFTIYLVWETFQKGVFCPGHWVVWGMNVYLGGRLIKHLLSDSDQES